MSTKPLKRNSALQPLSREHHFALLLCWKIRRGLELNIALERIGKYVQAMWKHQIADHFDIEERYVFSIMDQSDELVLKAVLDHRLLKRLVSEEPFTIKTLNRRAFRAACSF